MLSTNFPLHAFVLPLHVHVQCSCLPCGSTWSTAIHSFIHLFISLLHACVFTCLCTSGISGTLPEFAPSVRKCIDTLYSRTCDLTKHFHATHTMKMILISKQSIK